GGQAALAGALAARRAAPGRRDEAAEMARNTAERLNREVAGPNARWRGEVDEREGLVFARISQGVEERRVIDWMLLQGSEARRLDGDGDRLREVYDRPGKLVAREREHLIPGPSALVD